MIDWQDITPGYKSRLDKLRAMTPYELLDVATGVSLAELKNAYRKKVLTHHPDKNDPFMKQYAEEYTKLINLAYEQIKREVSK